ncbi:MAG: barstar family protein [Alkalinema sp. RU_4_3]|nr:barstar family protein [Alkalinema sp. RU_4_3]
MQYPERPTYPAFNPKAATPGLYTLEPSESITTFLDVAKQANFQVFHIEGQQITSLDRYFQVLADLFQFPNYFGKNWDAVADCLMDLAWEEGDRVLIVYSNYQDLREDRNWEVAMEVWSDAIEFWQRQGVMVAVVLG